MLQTFGSERLRVPRTPDAPPLAMHRSEKGDNKHLTLPPSLFAPYQTLRPSGKYSMSRIVACAQLLVLFRRTCVGRDELLADPKLRKEEDKVLNAVMG